MRRRSSRGDKAEEPQDNSLLAIRQGRHGPAEVGAWSKLESKAAEVDSRSRRVFFFTQEELADMAEGQLLGDTKTWANAMAWAHDVPATSSPTKEVTVGSATELAASAEG